MNRLSPHQALAASAGELAALPGETLYQLQQDAADLLALTQAIVERTAHALAVKYAGRAHAMRQAAGRDTGVVHFEDGGVRITADLPERIEWDQRRLAEIVRRLLAHGSDLTAAVDLHYHVPETHYCAWTAPLQQMFAPARIRSLGEPNFRLARLSERSET
jgi:hypothetical protein